MLVDSHCHLDFPEFYDELDNIVERAGMAGVTHMLTICTRISKFKQVWDVAAYFDNIWCSVGIHPHNVDEEEEASAEKLLVFAADPKVVAFGETGLDFFYDHSSRENQERSFRAHIEASRHSGLPVIIHTRDADEDTIRILRDENAKGAFPGVIHCFSSGEEVASAAVDLGLYISLSGIITFKGAEELRQTVKKLPLDRLLLETDSPYLAPVPRRGKRNEPAFTKFTAAKLAELMSITVDEMAIQTTENFFMLFKKALPQVNNTLEKSKISTISP